LSYFLSTSTIYLGVLETEMCASSKIYLYLFLQEVHVTVVFAPFPQRYVNTDINNYYFSQLL